MCCITLGFAFLPSANAQTNYGEDFKSRLYVGGTFGLGLGTVTNIDLSPMIGYNINDYFSGGVGMTYMFYSYNQPGQDVRTSFYGGRLFLRAVPLPQTLPGLYLHAEIENINNERYIADPVSGFYNLQRAWTPGILVGPGFRQQAGSNSYFTIGLYYNLLDDGTAESSIYNGPIVYRIGFIFGLY
jgi:long-subunit fatty acid transport protein